MLADIESVMLFPMILRDCPHLLLLQLVIISLKSKWFSRKVLCKMNLMLSLTNK